MKEKLKRTELISIVAAVVSVVAAIISIGVGVYQHKDNQRFQTELETPRLIVNSDKLEPGRDRPSVTNFPVMNLGKRHALVTKVDFIPKKILQTPEGLVPFCDATPDAVVVFFQAVHYLKEEERFSMDLSAEPIEVPGGKNLLLRMSIGEESWVGKTYVGDVYVHYDRGKVLKISSVTLDVVTSMEAYGDYPPAPGGIIID